MARKLLYFVLIFKKIYIQNLPSIAQCKENSFENEKRGINKSDHKFIECIKYFAKNGGNIAVLSIVLVYSFRENICPYARFVSDLKVNHTKYKFIFIFKKFKMLHKDFGCHIKTPVTIFSF